MPWIPDGPTLLNLEVLTLHRRGVGERFADVPVDCFLTLKQRVGQILFFSKKHAERDAGWSSSRFRQREMADDTQRYLAKASGLSRTM